MNNGYSCSSSGQCLSNTCKTNVFDGSVTSQLCANDNSYCIDSGGTVRASGTAVGDSACYGSTTGGSVWLAQTGRWMVQNKTGSMLAVIDKYGSMGVRGTASYSQSSFDNGWQLANKSGSVQASVSSTNGNLKVAGVLTSRTTPSGTGLQVQNSTGTMEAIITSAGAILLRGDLAYSLNTLS